MTKAIRLAGALICGLSASASAEDAPGDLSRCLIGAGNAYHYCVAHFPIQDCQRDHLWTQTQCAIQYPF